MYYRENGKSLILFFELKTVFLEQSSFGSALWRLIGVGDEDGGWCKSQVGGPREMGNPYSGPGLSLVCIFCGVRGGSA